MSYVAASLQPRHFAQLTTSIGWNRLRFEGGVLRHIIARLDGAKVLVDIDGLVMECRMIAIRDFGPSRGTRVVVESDLSDGTTQRTAFAYDKIGTIFPIGLPLDVKHEIIASIRREERAAMDSVRADWEAEGLNYGKWTAEAMVNPGEVIVSYQPQREGAGRGRVKTVRLQEASV